MLFGVATTAMAADPLNSDRKGFFVGASIGSSTTEQSRIDLGVNAGYQFGQYVRVEADYGYGVRTTGDAQTLMVNAIAQYRIPDTTLTPYVLVGTGVGFSNYTSARSGDVVGLYNVGVGARVALNKNVELDARYRYVEPFNVSESGIKQENRVTVGLNYRF